MTRLCSLLLLFALCLPVTSQEPTAKPTLSTEPMSADRMEIYRDFLQSYTNGSKSVLNVAQTTVPFHAQDYDLKGCLGDFTAPDLKSTAIHLFSQDVFPKDHARLVDPTKHKRNDPGDAIRHGASVEDAVTAGFASGVFTFSEIVFDRTHTHAALNYSFVCGSLCGHGGVVVYELDHGKWKPSKKSCGNWIS